jgi:MFS family permease
MNKIKSYLDKSPSIVFVAYTILAAFATYSCMYAFRKPFASATFDDIVFWGIDYKILIIISQAFGYMLSKFIGIKFVSEMKKDKRAIAIIGTIFIAWIALLLFAVVPKPYNIPFMFVNGLFLGMVWGFVFSYLEGRRFTEILGAGLSISFIFSSGFVKTVGGWFLQQGVSPVWMPFVTGGVFIVPLVFFVSMLNQIPEPNEEDVELRTERKPMTYMQRVELFKKYALGFVVLIFSYILLTAMRDFRDNFAAEIWNSLGFGDTPEIFTYTEIPISLGILIIMGLLFIFKNNFKALMVSHILILSGFVLLGLSTLLFINNIISPVLWFTLTGGGLYMAYVPFNSIFFERLIAAFRSTANVGFLIYLADSFGYLGSMGILIYKNFANPNLSWLSFYTQSSILISTVGIVLILISIIYFYLRYKRK